MYISRKRELSSCLEMIYEFSNVDAMLAFFIDINIKDRRYIYKEL